MNLTQYYQNIADKKAKQEFRNKVIESCKIQFATFYLWLRKNKVPPLAQEKINELIKQLSTD